MKALLVADDDLAIENIKQVLQSKSYDVIVYKWLLKALDNIEEVAPHLIVISTLDYPRHWKTLAQYATSGFGDYNPQVILYTDENFTEEEQKKAEILKVRGTFDSVTVEGLDKLREILEKSDDIFSGTDVTPALQEKEKRDIDLEELDEENKDGNDMITEIEIEDKDLISSEEIPTVESVMNQPLTRMTFPCQVLMN